MQDYLHQEISIICTVLPALPLQPFALRADTAPWRVFYFSAVGMSPKLCGTCADALPVIAAWLAFIHWFTVPGITNLIADLTGTVGLTWGSVWMHYKWHRQVQVMIVWEGQNVMHASLSIWFQKADFDPKGFQQSTHFAPIDSLWNTLTLLYPIHWNHSSHGRPRSYPPSHNIYSEFMDHSRFHD